jgi:hypothetical protein
VTKCALKQIVTGATGASVNYASLAPRLSSRSDARERDEGGGMPVLSAVEGRDEEFSRSSFDWLRTNGFPETFVVSLSNHECK